MILILFYEAASPYILPNLITISALMPPRCWDYRHVTGCSLFFILRYGLCEYFMNIKWDDWISENDTHEVKASYTTSEATFFLGSSERMHYFCMNPATEFLFCKVDQTNYWDLKLFLYLCLPVCVTAVRKLSSIVCPKGTNASTETKSLWKDRLCGIY